MLRLGMVAREDLPLDPRTIQQKAADSEASYPALAGLALSFFFGLKLKLMK